MPYYGLVERSIDLRLVLVTEGVERLSSYDDDSDDAYASCPQPEPLRGRYERLSGGRCLKSAMSFLKQSVSTTESMNK